MILVGVFDPSNFGINTLILLHACINLDLINVNFVFNLGGLASFDKIRKKKKFLTNPVLQRAKK